MGPESQRKPLGVLRDGSVPLLRSHTIKSHLHRTVPTKPSSGRCEKRGPEDFTPVETPARGCMACRRARQRPKARGSQVIAATRSYRGTGMGVARSIARERLGRGQGPMNRRDQELLARQMRHFQPSARSGGVIMLVLVAAFAAGMTLGGIFSFASQHGQQPSDDGRTALAFFLGGGQNAAR